MTSRVANGFGRIGHNHLRGLLKQGSSNLGAQIVAAEEDAARPPAARRRPGDGLVTRLYAAGRWMYRGGRPNPVARFLNAVSAIQFGSGVLVPHTWVTLAVRGRRTGRIITCPLVVVEYDGHRHLVGMLGEDTNWARNVRAADGSAVLRHREHEAVRLVEVPPGDRAPILRRYLAVAPGARPHFPVDRDAPRADFEKIAADYPVFRVERTG